MGSHRLPTWHSAVRCRDRRSRFQGTPQARGFQRKAHLLSLWSAEAQLDAVLLWMAVSGSAVRQRARPRAQCVPTNTASGSVMPERLFGPVQLCYREPIEGEHDET